MKRATKVNAWGAAAAGLATIAALTLLPATPGWARGHVVAVGTARVVRTRPVVLVRVRPVVVVRPIRTVFPVRTVRVGWVRPHVVVSRHGCRSRR